MHIFFYIIKKKLTFSNKFFCDDLIDIKFSFGLFEQHGGQSVKTLFVKTFF